MATAGADATGVVGERMNTKKKRVQCKTGNSRGDRKDRRVEESKKGGNVRDLTAKVIRSVFTTVLLTILSISTLANLGLLHFMSGHRRLESFADFPEEGIFLGVPEGQRTPNTEESDASEVPSFEGEEQRSEEVKNVIMAEVRYVSVMPIPGMSGAPFFEGANITEFLERYTDQCDDAQLKLVDRIKRLPRYCSLTIGQYIKTLPEWINKDWDELVNVLQEEYKDQDAFQQMNSRLFLEALKAKPRTTEDDVKQFIRQFTAISATLVERGQLENYTRGVWFLNGLPGDVRGKVIRKNRVDINKPETIKFDNLVKTATEIYASNKTVREFSDSRAKQEGLSELVDSLGQPPAIPKTEGRLVPPVVSPKGVSVEAVEELTQAFNALALAAKASIGPGNFEGRPGFSRPGGGNQAGAYPAGPTGRIDSTRPPQASYAGRRPSNSPIGVNAARTFGDRPTHCFYCLEDGHFRRDCPDFLIDVERGLVHDYQGWMYYGRSGGGGQVLWVPRGVPGKEVARADWKVAPQPGNSGRGAEGTGRAGLVREVQQRPIAMVEDVGGKAAGVVRWEDSDVEEDAGDWEAIGMAGARSEKPKAGKDDKWVNPRKVLNGRVQKEKELAVPKVPRVGRWKQKDQVEGVSGEGVEQGEIVEEMEIDEEQTEKLKRVGPRVTRKVERYLDLLKQEARPLELLDKLLDNELKGITGREVLACSDILQKLLFKNMASVKTHRGTSSGDSSGQATESVPVRSAGVVDKIDESLLLVVRSPKVRIRIGSLLVMALIDCGSEANLITTAVAARAGLPVRPNPNLGMIGHLGEREKFGGLCEDVPVEIGSVSISNSFFTLGKAENEVVLGQPFIVASLLSFSYSGGSQFATVVNDERTKQVTVKVADLAESRTESDIFPENE